MMKRVISLALVLVLAFGILSACGKDPITAEEAVQIVQQELGASIDVGNPHCHEGDYNNKDCFIVYITLNGENVYYAVEKSTGKIVGRGLSTHNH